MPRKVLTGQGYEHDGRTSKRVTWGTSCDVVTSLQFHAGYAAWVCAVSTEERSHANACFSEENLRLRHRGVEGLTEQYIPCATK